jgi:hypothetical protein
VTGPSETLDRMAKELLMVPGRDASSSKHCGNVILPHS